MKLFCQKDKRWSDLTIGDTELTLGNYGCFVVSLSMMLGKAPDVVLAALNRNKAFNSKGMLLSDVAAKVLGMSYKGKVNDGKAMSIGETSHYKEIGIPQHFFLYLGEGKIADPLDGLEKQNPYKILNYRLFKPKRDVFKEEIENKEEVKEPIILPTVDKTITEPEQKSWIDMLINFIKGLFRV